MPAMTFMRTHHTAALVIAVVAAAFTATFAFARPTYQSRAMSSPPNDLPYTSVSFTSADAVAAFAAVGLGLTPRSTSPTVKTFGDHGDSFEVDVFGNPQRVKAAGFHDYVVLNGHYVHLPRTCGTAVPKAERWKGNVRVIVTCTTAAGLPSDSLRRADRALARLGA